MRLNLIILLCPALALARIDVDIKGTFEQDVQVGLSGHDVDIISDLEIDSFKLWSNNVKAGVEAYFGQWPTDVYLKSPTPWGDLYKTYGWKQVVRTLIPINGRVVSMTSRPEILMNQIFQNNSTTAGTYDVAISQSVANTVSSSWSKTDELSVSEKITVGVDMVVIQGSSETTFGYKAVWGQNQASSKTVTVGATSGVNVKLEPGQAVVAQLEAARGTLQVEIEYEATVNGDVAANYEKTYKGHHFWSLPLGPIMEKAGLANRVTSRQTLVYGFFSNSKVIVSDMKTNAKLFDIPLED